MAIPIIDSLLLATDLPLDSRTIVSTPYDVSRYFYAGFIGFETSGNLPFYIDNSLGINYFGDGVGVTLAYVDGSLAARDISINYIDNYNGIQDVSIISNSNSIVQLDASIISIKSDINIIDSSIIYIDSSISQLFLEKADLSYVNQTFLRESSLGTDFIWNAGLLEVSIGIGVSQSYVDGSLAARDVSINYLDNYNSIQDISINLIENDIIQIEASIGIINSEISQLDASIINLENSKVNRSGDTMTGDLIIETDLSVNGKGTFGQFNVSGTSFPGGPNSGDKFYRTDLETDFQYDSSRGKWLSVNRNTFSAGNNRSNSGNTKYLSIGTAVMDSITGIHMWKPGVITKLSVQNNRIVTGAGRSLELRVNNSTTYKETITITTGNTGAFKFSNLDVSSGDVIQLLTVPGSDRIDDIIFNFEVAERA